MTQLAYIISDTGLHISDTGLQMSDTGLHVSGAYILHCLVIVHVHQCTAEQSNYYESCVAMQPGPGGQVGHHLHLGIQKEAVIMYVGKSYKKTASFLCS